MGKVGPSVLNVAYFAHLSATVLGLVAILWLAKKKALPPMPPPMWLGALLTIGVVVFELVAFKASTPPDRFRDFLFAYYPAGQAMAHGDPSSLRALTDQGVSGFVNMPIIAYLFAPLGMLGPGPATAVFTLVGLGFAIAAWFLLVNLARLEQRERWLLALLFLASGPLINAVKLGNTSHFILFALAAGLVLLRANRSGWAGVLLGAAAMIKPPLALFGLFFALRRDVRGVLGFGGLCAAVSLLSVALFGWADNLHWFQTSIVEFSRGWLAAFNVQSIPGFLARLHADAQLTDWSPRPPAPVDKLVAQAATALIFLVAAVAAFRGRRLTTVEDAATGEESRDLQYLLVICLCLVSSPLTWSHYYAWLLVPTAFFLGSRLSFKAQGPERAIGWAAILLLTPLVSWPWSIQDPAIMALYRAVVLSHVLLGGLLWTGLVARRLSQVQRPGPGD